MWGTFWWQNLTPSLQAQKVQLHQFAAKWSTKTSKTHTPYSTTLAFSKKVARFLLLTKSNYA
jgi:hypothetical protein